MNREFIASELLKIAELLEARITDKGKSPNEVFDIVLDQLSLNDIKPAKDLLNFIKQQSRKGKSVLEILGMFGIKVISFSRKYPWQRSGPLRDDWIVTS